MADLELSAMEEGKKGAFILNPIRESRTSSAEPSTQQIFFNGEQSAAGHDFESGEPLSTIPCHFSEKWERLTSGWVGSNLVFSLWESEKRVEKAKKKKRITEVRLSRSTGENEFQPYTILFVRTGRFKFGAAGSLDGHKVAIFCNNEKCIYVWNSTPRPWLPAFLSRWLLPPSTNATLMESTALPFEGRNSSSSSSTADFTLYGHRQLIRAVAFNHDAAKPRLASVGCGLKTKGQKASRRASDQIVQKTSVKYVDSFLQSLFPMFLDEEVECIGEIIIWDEDLHQSAHVIHVRIAKEVHASLQHSLNEKLFSICWSPGCAGNPESAVACGGTHCVFVYDSRTGKQLCKPSEMSWDEDAGEGDTARVIAWSPAWSASESDNYSYIAVATSLGQITIHVWQCKVDRNRLRVRKLEADEFNCRTVLKEDDHQDEITGLSWQVEEASKSLMLLATTKIDIAFVWRKSCEDKAWASSSINGKYPLPFRPTQAAQKK